MKPGGQRFYGPPVLLLTHRPRDWPAIHSLEPDSWNILLRGAYGGHPSLETFAGTPVPSEGWWSHGESRPDLRDANALLYCLSYGPARSVGAAPTRLSFGDSAAQAGALRKEIGSPGWVFTSNETRSKVE